MTGKTNSAQKQRTPVSLLDVVGFFVDLAMFLPRNKPEIPPAFRKLLEENRVSQAGTDYIGRIDHEHVLNYSEHATLAREGTYYLISLQFFYVMQMQIITEWQTNAEPNDPRLATNMDIFYYHAGRIEACLRAFGWSEHDAYRQHFNYLRESERYRRKRTWEQAVRDGHLYPALSELMRFNMAKRILMTDAKRAVIDKYSAKIHGDASKFFRKLYRDYRFVGIRHFDEK